MDCENKEGARKSVGVIAVWAGVLTLAQVLTILYLLGRGIINEANHGGLRAGWDGANLSFVNHGARAQVLLFLSADNGYEVTRLPEPALLLSHWNEVTIDPRQLKWIDTVENKAAAPPAVGATVIAYCKDLNAVSTARD